MQNHKAGGILRAIAEKSDSISLSRESQLLLTLFLWVSHGDTTPKRTKHREEGCTSV